MNKEVRVIKRYQNRKLYDTNQSCYVTLEEISQMIKNGDDLRVIDNKSKADITSITLTQLLYESERKSKNAVPVEMLKEIIRSGDGSFSGYIRANLASQLKKFDTADMNVSAPAAATSTPATAQPMTQFSQ